MPNEIVTVECGECHANDSVSVDPAGMQRWRDGAFIDEALPGLTADERDLLLSGICGLCFDFMFADEHDEYSDECHGDDCGF